MEEALESLTPYDDLSITLKSKLQPSSEQAYHNLCVSYHSINHIRFKGYPHLSFYRDLIRHLRLKLEIFPYYLCRYLNFTSPFDYYIEMLCDLLRTQKPYDTLPTFTAADILRIIGIHRNSYTDLLQKCKEKGWISKISRAIRGMLPKIPLSVPVEAWWLVYPLLHKKSRKGANKNEVDCLHEICKDYSNKTSNYAGQYDREALEGLYRAVVVEFDVEMDSCQFELVREIKSFVNDKDGFGLQLGEVLKMCESYKDCESICESTGLRHEIVKDALGILSRLGFLDVLSVDFKNWHKSWTPLLDLENSLNSSIAPSYNTSNSEELVKVTFAVGEFGNNYVVKALKEYLCKWQVEIIESSQPAVLINSSRVEPVIFTNLTASDSPLYRLFKIKYCGGAPVVYFVKGFVVTVLPESLRKHSNFLVHSEKSLKEVHKNDLMAELSKNLMSSAIFVIPIEQRLLNLITLPLPLSLVSLKDRYLASFLRERNLVSHFESFVGYIEIATLSDRNYVVVNQFHGIPFNEKELAVSIAGNLADAAWFKYNNLEVVSEAQQDEIFQYREFICGIDIDQGFIELS